MPETPSPVRRPRRWWLLAIGGIVIVTGTVIAIRRPFAAKIETVAVERRTLREEVEVSGTVEAQRDVVLKAEVAGPITARLIDEGARVAPGAPLLTIDIETARLQLEQTKRNAAAQETAAQTELAGAQRALSEAESRRTTAIRTLTNDVARTETALAQAERDANASTLLVKEEAVSKNSADQTQTQLQQAKIALKAARDTLTRTDTDYTEIVAARNRVAAAHTSLDNARKQGQVAIDLAANSLAKTQLRAPFAGTVSSWLVNKGDYVAPGTPLASFQDLDDLVLNLPVDETDLPKMRVAGAVNVTFDAYPDKMIPGKILTIGTSSSKVKDVMVFPVKVRFANPDHLIRPGMSGDASVLVQEKTNVVAVPLRAVRREGGKYYVTVRQGRTNKQVQVDAGIVTIDYIEARSGVAPGDTLVIGAAAEAAKK